MNRKLALRILYVTAWLAAAELAAETLLGVLFDPLPSVTRTTVRVVQLAALAASAYAILILALRPGPRASGRMDPETTLLHANMILKAHFADMRDHHNLAGLLILLSAFYAAAAYAQSLNPIAIPTTSLLIGLLSLAGLSYAWWHTHRVFQSEEKLLHA